MFSVHLAAPFLLRAFLPYHIILGAAIPAFNKGNEPLHIYFDAHIIADLLARFAIRQFAICMTDEDERFAREHFLQMLVLDVGHSEILKAVDHDHLWASRLF